MHGDVSKRKSLAPAKPSFDAAGEGQPLPPCAAAISRSSASTNVAVLEPVEIVFRLVTPGSVNTAVECLRIGTILDRYRETARMMLEPWIVEAALARLAGKQFTREEQEVVLSATRTPVKVRWPDWWVVMPGR